MSDGSRGRVRLGELADATIAPADPAAHAGFVADLAAVTRTADAVAAVAERLLGEGGRGRLVFLEWLARVRVRAPAGVLDRVPDLLADPAVPDDLRARVAARALRMSARPRAFLGRLAPSLTAGLSPLAALARLRAVQSRLRQSPALDRLIDRRERRLRLACPRCGVRLDRPALARHLVDAHGLLLDNGHARRPDRMATDLRRRFAAVRDTTLLDAAAHLADPAALRRWAARTAPTPADLAPAAVVAGGHGCGLCPRCLTELPPSVEPLPPPLTPAGGRLSGEGHVVAAAGGIRSGPRDLGVAVAAAVLIGGIGLRLPTALTLVAAAVAYALVRLLRAPLPPAADRVVDRAWTVLLPRLPDGPDRSRFLVRLCRASVGRGDAGRRVEALDAVAARAATPVLRAAVRSLQAEDAGRLGVDRVAAVAGLIAAGLRGDESLAFAEHAAELFLTRDPAPTPGERARLGVLGLDAAFAAGFVPRTLADLGAACPRLRDLVAAEPLPRVGLKHVVWALRDDRPWDRFAPATGVFELARVAPTLGGRLLAAYPDLLLYHRPPAPVDDTLGWVLVCARGVVVGGRLVNDPDAAVGVEAGRPGGPATLVFGPHRFALPRRPPPEFVTHLRRLLRIRPELLFPRLDAALCHGTVPPALTTLGRACRCGVAVFVSVGEVGRAMRAT